MKLIWCSDIHLNFLKEPDRQEFYRDLKKAEGNKILITGDIGESHNVEQYLEEMKEATGKTIYFVAGNHDYYGSSIEHMRKVLKKNSSAIYLPRRFGYKLSKTTWLVGQDGWGDCRNGDVEASRIQMADWFYIDEFKKLDDDDLIEALQKVADGDAERLCKSVLRVIKKGAERVVIASHVPPFEEACIYAGKKSTPSGLPFFSSQIFGSSMLNIVEKHPYVEFLWLCGHTHADCVVKKRPNFTIRVASAVYFRPVIEGVLDV